MLHDYALLPQYHVTARTPYIVFREISNNDVQKQMHCLCSN